MGTIVHPLPTTVSVAISQSHAPPRPYSRCSTNASTQKDLHILGSPIHTPRVLVSLRLSLCVLAAMAVWLVTGLARAEAPQCDARGAITFAPNPTLEEPNASVDVGDTDDCSGKTNTDVALHHGQGSSSASAQDDAPQASPTRLLSVHEATPTGTTPPTLVASFVSRNERDRLDRPPR